MNKEIPVFFAVDNGYIPFLSVALRSLIDNTSKENIYAIKILYTNVTEENKIKIKTSFLVFMVGREGFEPSYSNENRFTVCRL